MMKIGIYSLAHVHAGAYAQVLVDRDDVEVLCVDPDGTPERAGNLPEGAPCAASLEEFLAWGPDAVIICTENSRHRAAVELLAPRGMHILCEKPLAPNRADAEAIVATCQAAGVQLMVAYPVRFTPEFTQLHASLAAGGLGTVLGVFGTNNGSIPTADYAWFADPELSGGGAIVDHTVHVLDLMQGLFDQAPVSVRAVANRIMHADKDYVGTDTSGLVQVTYDNGLTVTIDCSWTEPDLTPNWGGLTLELVTTTGTVEIEPFGATVLGEAARGAEIIYETPGANPDGLLIDAFIRSVTDGTEPDPGALSGVRGAAVVEAAMESARSGGQPVTIAWN